MVGSVSLQSVAHAHLPRRRRGSQLEGWRKRYLPAHRSKEWRSADSISIAGLRCGPQSKKQQENDMSIPCYQEDAEATWTVVRKRDGGKR